MDSQRLYFRKVNPTAIIPTRATDGSIGYDIRTKRDGATETVPAGGRLLIKTGWKISYPLGCYCRIAPCSGLALKKGINVGAGVIDYDFEGEVRVILFNHGEDAVTFSPGDKIAQLILELAITPDAYEIRTDPQTGEDVYTHSVLEEKATRGAGGFGSTDKKYEPIETEELDYEPSQEDYYCSKSEYVIGNRKEESRRSKREKEQPEKIMKSTVYRVCRGKQLYTPEEKLLRHGKRRSNSAGSIEERLFRISNTPAVSRRSRRSWSGQDARRRRSLLRSEGCKRKGNPNENLNQEWKRCFSDAANITEKIHRYFDK